MQQLSIIIPGRATAFARAGRGGGYTFTPKPQRDHMTLIKHEAMLAMRGEPPWQGPISLAINVEYLAPTSWSRRKRESAVWKTSAPDIDNVVKLIKDSLSKIVFRDDAQVVVLTARKLYAETERTTIFVRELDKDVPT